MEKVRTFKHKITGKIAEQRTSYGNIDHENYVIQQFNGHLPKEFIENSNDWEEIIEKDYEILSFISNSKTIYERLDAFGSKDGYGLDGKDMYYGPLDSFLENLKNNKFSIYSVKRLSDGEIFTIGDDILEQNEHSKIEYFELRGDDLVLRINHQITKGSSTILLKSNFKKYIKQPLFITEDGVEIFMGDSCYYISDFTIINVRKIHNLTAWNTWDITFSSKQAAEEYIIMNKPCLSLNDIENNYLESLSDIGQGFLYKLKKLVESKL